MIYNLPSPTDAIDQGDLIERCPVLVVRQFDAAHILHPTIEVLYCRVLVLSQTCDLANSKTTMATVAEVFDAQAIVNQGLLKPEAIKGSLRAGRIWGWYFLPASPDLGLPEMIVDLRRLHTVRLDLLRSLCAAGHRRGRIQSPYREHLAKHFADTFSRIGLPRPYETM